MKVTTIQTIVASPVFHKTSVGAIIMSAILMGLETNTALRFQWQSVFSLANWLLQGLFVIEISLRIASYGRLPIGFFKDGWNIFDFTIVALSLLPTTGPFLTVARLARILRVARLLSASKDLRLIIDTMFRSIPSLGHVSLLLCLLLYIYGVMGYHLFHATDPAHWGSLSASLLSLFTMLTLEGWVEMLKVLLPMHPFSWVFFISFIVIAVFVVVNLFIAVVINNLQTVRAEHKISDEVK